MYNVPLAFYPVPIRDNSIGWWWWCGVKNALLMIGLCLGATNSKHESSSAYHYFKHKGHDSTVELNSLFFLAENSWAVAFSFFELLCTWESLLFIMKKWLVQVATTYFACSYYLCVFVPFPLLDFLFHLGAPHVVNALGTCLSPFSPKSV